jgi:HAMP domain-containing protein
LLAVASIIFGLVLLLIVIGAAALVWFIFFRRRRIILRRERQKRAVSDATLLHELPIEKIEAEAMSKELFSNIFLFVLFE